jgi:Domain of unknown function (DUF4112)
VTHPPRDVGPIEGREVVRDRPPPGPSAAPPSSAASPPPPYSPPDAGAAPESDAVAGGGSRLPVLRPQTQAAFAQAMYDIRHSRGRNVPNSRPLPDWVQRLAWVLDSAFKVPGTADRRVGVDGLLAIVPVVGDAAGIALSLTVVLAGVAAGVSIPTLIRMLLNVGLEALVGLVPFGGTLFDMVFKANIRNVVLMEKDLADRRATRRSSLAVLVLSLGVLVVGAVMTVVISLASVAFLVWLLLRIFGATG